MVESDLEQLALTWFQDTGWDYRAGPDIAPDSETPSAATTARCCYKASCARPWRGSTRKYPPPRWTRWRTSWPSRITPR